MHSSNVFYEFFIILMCFIIYCNCAAHRSKPYNNHRSKPYDILVCGPSLTTTIGQNLTTY